MVRGNIKLIVQCLMVIAIGLLSSACKDDNGGYPMSVKLPQSGVTKEVVGDKPLFSCAIMIGTGPDLVSTPDSFEESGGSNEDWDKYWASGECKVNYDWLTVINYGRRIELMASPNTTGHKRKLRVEGRNGIPPSVIIDVTQE